MRETDKIISLKEDIDAISWSRVLEIGKLFQEVVDEADRVALARELVSIAQSNLKLNVRLGIGAAPSSGHVMASGIEVIGGGLAEAALEERAEQHERVEDGALPVADERPATSEPAESTELQASVPLVGVHDAYEPSEIDFQAAEVRAECDLVAKNDPDEDDFIEAAQAVMNGGVEPEPETVATTVPEPEGKTAEPETLDQLLAVAAELEEAVDELTAATAALDQPEAEDGSTEPVEPAISESALEPGFAPDTETQPAPEPQCESVPAACQAEKRRFARFSNLYESRDGGLCVFEDEHGHLVAVDSSKLA